MLIGNIMKCQESGMATIYKNVNDEAYLDEDGYISHSLGYMLLKENGVVFQYRPEFKTYCIAVDIEENVEDVVIPDEIYIGGVGNCAVKECWTALRKTEKLRKIKRLSIGKNVTEIGFWQYDQLERLTIPESLNDSIETFIDHSPELVSIIVKGNEKDDYYSAGKIRMIESDNKVKRQREEEDRKKRQREKELEEKYKDFSSYTNKMSNLSTWYLTIICVIPYLYVAIKTTNNVDGFGSFLGWGCLVFGLLIGWFIACILSFYTGYAYKDNFLIKLFCPIVTVPLSWILLMIGANILALISSCSLLGFLDPRFL